MDSRGRGRLPQVEGFEIHEVIGRGGFSTVYRAVEPRLGRTVALKVMHPSAQTDDASLRRFERECQAIGSLTGHRSVVTVFATGATDDGDPYLALEYLPGGSIEGRLKTEGTFPWAEVVAVGAGVSEALDAAHQLGILHRDVKPANVLADQYGRFKLGDFGIAGLASSGHTTTGNSAMTVAFAAPEVLLGKRATAASDLYGLGATLYALLVGAPAFSSVTDESIVPMVLRVTNQDLDPIAEELAPLELRKLISELMAKEPEVRPTSASVVRDRLKEIVSSDPRPRTTPRVAPVPVVDEAGSPPHEADGDPLPDPTQPPRRPKRPSESAEPADCSAETLTAETPTAETPTTEPVAEPETPAREDADVLGGSTVVLGRAAQVAEARSAAAAATAAQAEVDARVEAEAIANEADTERNDRPSEDTTISGAPTAEAPASETGERAPSKRTALVAVAVGVVVLVLGTAAFASARNGSDDGGQTAATKTAASGDAAIAVPRVAGLTEAKALAALEEAGLTGKVVAKRNDAKAARGTVLNQDPAAGKGVDSGSTVKLAISLGPPAPKVPKLSGKTLAEAMVLLDKAGLKGEIVPEFSSVAPGTVLRTNPAAGKTVKPGAVIKMVVAEPAPTELGGTVSGEATPTTTPQPSAGSTSNAGGGSNPTGSGAGSTGGASSGSTGGASSGSTGGGSVAPTSPPVATTRPPTPTTVPPTTCRKVVDSPKYWDPDLGVWVPEKSHMECG